MQILSSPTEQTRQRQSTTNYGQYDIEILTVVTFKSIKSIISIFQLE